MNKNPHTPAPFEMPKVDQIWCLKVSKTMCSLDVVYPYSIVCANCVQSYVLPSHFFFFFSSTYWSLPPNKKPKTKASFFVGPNFGWGRPRSLQSAFWAIVLVFWVIVSIVLWVSQIWVPWPFCGFFLVYVLPPLLSFILATSTPSPCSLTPPSIFPLSLL